VRKGGLAMTGIFLPVKADTDPSLRLPGSGTAFGVAYTSYNDEFWTYPVWSGDGTEQEVSYISETTWYDAAGNTVAQRLSDEPSGPSQAYSVTFGQVGTAFGDAYFGCNYMVSSLGRIEWVDWLGADGFPVVYEFFGSDGSYSITVEFQGMAFGQAYYTYENNYNAQGALTQTTWNDAKFESVVVESYQSGGGYDVLIYSDGTAFGQAYFSYDNQYDAHGALTTTTWFDITGSAVVVKSYQPDGGYDIKVHATGVAFGQNYATYDNFHTASGTLDHTIWQGSDGQNESVKSYHSGGGYDVWIGQGGFELDTSFAAFDYDFTASGALDRETLFASDSSVAAVKTIADDGSYDIHRYFAGAPGGTASTDMFYSAAGDLTKTLVYDSSGGFTIVLPHAS